MQVNDFYCALSTHRLLRKEADEVTDLLVCMQPDLYAVQAPGFCQYINGIWEVS